LLRRFFFFWRQDRELDTTTLKEQVYIVLSQSGQAVRIGHDHFSNTILTSHFQQPGKVPARRRKSTATLGEDDVSSPRTLSVCPLLQVSHVGFSLIALAWATDPPLHDQQPLIGVAHQSLAL